MRVLDPAVMIANAILRSSELQPTPEVVLVVSATASTVVASDARLGASTTDDLSVENTSASGRTTRQFVDAMALRIG